ncbi:MAG: hypothetical protein SOZ84_00890 [Treponema sp.]|nr:hypothetical protein [Treponema sp.]
MITKKLFLSLGLLLVVSIPSLTAWSMAQEYVDIQNNLNSRITVYCKFQHKDGNTLPDFPSQWDQVLANYTVRCKSYFETDQTESYKPHVRISLISYTPEPRHLGSVAEDLEVIGKIPLEQKLKELFKTLVISDAEGKVLLTLDDFSKARVERNNRRYTIIIGDYLYQ